MVTDIDARRFVTDCVEGTGVATAEQVDMNLLLSQLYELAGGSWDMGRIDEHEFWAVVERAAMAAVESWRGGELLA